MASQLARSKARSQRTAMEILANSSSNPEIKQAALAILDCMDWLDDNFSDLQDALASIQGQQRDVEKLLDRVRDLERRQTR